MTRIVLPFAPEHGGTIGVRVNLAGSCGDPPCGTVKVAIDGDRGVRSGKQGAGCDRTVVFKNHRLGLVISWNCGIEIRAAYQFGMRGFGQFRHIQRHRVDGVLSQCHLLFPCFAHVSVCGVKRECHVVGSERWNYDVECAGALCFHRGGEVVGEGQKNGVRRVVGHVDVAGLLSYHRCSTCPAEFGRLGPDFYPGQRKHSVQRVADGHSHDGAKTVEPQCVAAGQVGCHRHFNPLSAVCYSVGLFRGEDDGKVAITALAAFCHYAGGKNGSVGIG